jgi:hypothetical protein
MLSGAREVGLDALRFVDEITGCPVPDLTRIDPQA